MSVSVDVKYLQYLSFLLDRFVQKDQYLWNFRCPFCGDSAKSKSKARGYVLRHENSLIMKCHNCGSVKGISQLISELKPELLSNYLMESMQRGTGNFSKFVKKRSNESTGKFVRYQKPNLKNIAQLEHSNPGKKYVESRKIPRKYYNILYYADDWAKWIEEIVPGKYNFYPNEPRLVIPFWNRQGKLIGAQGRLLNNSLGKNIRYVTAKFGEENLVYGLERVNSNSTVYVVEGPLDSLFLDNSIAATGSNLKFIRSFGFNDVVYCWDNENRNDEILKLVSNIIKSGSKIFIWPENILEKDFNELSMNKGYNTSQIMNLIDTNTFRGLNAELKFSKWRKR
jgi:hypothetical protein